MTPEMLALGEVLAVLFAVGVVPVVLLAGVAVVAVRFGGARRES